MITVGVRDPGTGLYYRASLPPHLARRHDNGALISCGLTVGEDLDRSVLERWVRAGVATAVSHSDWNHGSCLSGCVRRGDASCRW